MKQKLKELLGTFVGMILYELLIFVLLGLSLMGLGYLYDIPQLKENAFYIALVLVAAIYALLQM